MTSKKSASRFAIQTPVAKAGHILTTPALFALLTGVLLMASLSACSSSSNSGSMSMAGRVMTDVQEFDVDGIHVLLRQSVSVPVVSSYLFIRGGAAATPADEPISTDQFAMAVATGSGSQNISKAYYRRKMLRMGSGISGESGRDYSDISMQCVRENFDTTWAYMSDIILHPAFDSVEFDNLKRSVLLSLKSVDLDPEGYTNFELDSIYFAGHPYGRTRTTQDVQRLTIPIARKHFIDQLVKSRLLLSVVGNVSREELTEKIKATIGKLPEGSYTPIKISDPPKAFAPALYYPPFQRKLPTNYVLAYFHVPSKGDTDYYAYQRLRNFFGGFVFNHIRVQRNLAYAPNVDEKMWRSSVGTISVQTAYVDSAVKVIFNDIDFFCNNYIRESAIREGVAGWTTRNYLKAETTGSQAAALGAAKLETGDWRDAFTSYEKLANVTPQQIVAAARKYLRNFNWVIVGDTTHITRSLLESR